MARLIMDSEHPAHFILANQGVGFYSEPRDDSLSIGIVNLMPTPMEPVRDFGLLFARHAKHNIQLLDFTPTPELYSTTREKQALRRGLLPLEALPTYNLDALVLTGFGGEEHEFEDIRFWPEVKAALDHAEIKNIPMLASCWGSHAALYHHHKIPKTYHPEEKISGIFTQSVIAPTHPLMEGIDMRFTMPVSRYGRSVDDKIVNNPNLIVLAESDETGAAVVTDGRILCLTGHPEYPVEALPNEYARDLEANTEHLALPINVFEKEDRSQGIKPISWDKNAGTLIRNWVTSVAKHKAITAVANQPATPSGTLKLVVNR